MPNWKTLAGRPTSSRCIVPISFLSFELTSIEPGVIWHRWKRKTAPPRSPDSSSTGKVGKRLIRKGPSSGQFQLSLAEKIVQACQRKLHAHSADDQSHKPRHHVVQQAARATCARPAAGHKQHNDPHYDHGYRDRDECSDWHAGFACATASVITPAIVPGL